MDISPSTRIALADNLRLVAKAVEDRDPSEDATLHELHAGIGRLMPTRPADASDQSPIVTALGAPPIPQEALDLLAWLTARHEDDRRERVCVCFEAGHDGYEVTADAELNGTRTVYVARGGNTLAEAASRTLAKVPK